jgi:hypothetical protein
LHPPKSELADQTRSRITVAFRASQNTTAIAQATGCGTKTMETLVMNLVKTLATLLLTACLGACSGVEISTWEPDLFAAGNFKTYSWRTEPLLNSAYSRDPMYQMDPIIRGALDNALTGKGYRRVTRGGDFTVDYIYAPGVMLGAPSQDASNIAPRAGVRPNANISQAQRDNAIALSGVKETRNVALQFNHGQTGKEVWRAVMTKIVANVNTADDDRSRSVMNSAIARATSKLPHAGS